MVIYHKFNLSVARPWIYSWLFIVLVGCDLGGADDANDNVVDDTFVVDTGPNITVASGHAAEISAQVTLAEGRAIQAYAWKQVSSGPVVALTNSDTVTVSLVAPEVSESTSITLRLEVMDDLNNSAFDDVTITVSAPQTQPPPDTSTPPPQNDENQAPEASAGDDVQVAPGAPVTLSASATDNDGSIVGYQWFKITGPAIDMAGIDTANLQFTAPTKAALFFFRLIVTDNSGAQAYDDVVVTVSNNTPPIANAGGDITVSSLDQVIITGSGDDTDGRVLRYVWSQLPGGPGLTLAGNNSATVSFTAPQVTTLTQLTLRLTITDDLGANAWDDVVITIMPDLNNIPPIANAGIDKVVNPGDSVTLSGSASDADGTIATYLWTQDNGPLVTLDGANTPSVGFVMPADINAGASLTLTLTVTDNSGDSSADQVVITANSPPSANAGADQAANLGANVTLQGSGTDSNGSVVSFMWKQLSGPTVTLSNANTNIVSFVAPTNDASITLELSVTDNHGAIGTDTVVVNVSAAPANNPPTANAGPDLMYNINEAVEIIGVGTDSDGTIAAYLWEQIAGPAVTLSGNTSASVNFVAPDVTNSAVVVLRFTVTDNGGATGVDEVSVTINAPQSNSLPTANAGADQTVNENDVVTLSGSGSDTDGTIASYLWQQVGGPSITIANPDQSSTTFVAPVVTTVTTITLRLTVTDNMGGSGNDEVIITINSSNQAPAANAGPDINAQSGEAVTITGSGSDTDGLVAGYLWTQLSGPPVTLTNSETTTVSFTAPSVMNTATITLRLTVTDDKGATGTDDVLVTINGNIAPVADAGADFSVSSAASVTVNGSGTDADGSVAQYVWTQVQGPAVAFTDMLSPSITFIAPTVLVNTDIVLRLTVIDDLGAVGTDDVIISVLAGGNVPPVANAGTDQVVNSADVVNLTGVGNDADGVIASYLWEQLSGMTVSLTNANNPAASFNAPTVTVSTELSFQLTVTDDAGDSHSDIVVVTVFPLATLSGTVTTAGATLIDSDVNNPDAPYQSNDTPETAQPITNPVVIGGYVNLPGAGPVGRSRTAGDVDDVYVVSLSNNQSIILNIGDTGSGNNDLDLYLLNEAGQEVDASLGRGAATESLLVPLAGNYLIRVRAFSGASNYVLSVGLAPQAGAQSNGWRLSDDFEPGDVIVKFNDTVGIAAAENSLSARAATVGMQAKAGAPGRNMLLNIGQDVQRARALNALAIRQVSNAANQTLQEKLDTILAAKALAKRSDVETISLNYRFYPTAVPNDTNYNLQWHYPFINLPQAWDITTGSSNVIVAVIDTGVLLAHPDLQGQLVPGYDFVSSNTNSGDNEPGIDANPDDPGDGGGVNSSSFHGTHVSGTIAAASNNNLGVAGVAWGAKIMPCRAIGINGGSSYDVEQCVRFAAGLPNDSGTVPAQRADIINLSLGGPTNSTIAPTAYRLAREAGVIVIAAAGNDGTNQLFAPASYDGVISVSAANISRNLASYSNFGSTIDVSAPGGDSGDVNLDGFFDGVLSTSGSDANNNPISFNYRFAAGTSMAAPHVAGVVALMKSVYPGLTPAIMDAMLANGDLTEDLGAAGRDNSFGYGLIDAQKAVLAAANAGGAPPTPSPLLLVTPTTISLGIGLSSAELNVSNAGGGALTVNNISNDASGWLTVAPAVVDGDGLGVYQIDVDRGGLPNGVYSATITVSTSAGVQTVALSMQVANVSTQNYAGLQYVTLIDAANSQLVNRIVVDAVAGNYNFSFSDVPLGTYRVYSSSDLDNDRVFCEPGESCGAFPTLDNTLSQEIFVDGSTSNVNGLDFTTGFSVNLSNP